MILCKNLYNYGQFIIESDLDGYRSNYNLYSNIGHPWPMASNNRVKETRESLLMSKAELAREARVSPITVARIEKGMPCRMETKRKILLALGLKLTEKDKIFKD